MHTPTTPNMLVNAEELAGLLRTALTQSLSQVQAHRVRELIGEAEDIDNSRLILVAHDHRHGTDVHLVRVKAGAGLGDVGDLLVAHNPSQFELEEGGSEWAAGSEIGPLIDLRHVNRGSGGAP